MKKEEIKIIPLGQNCMPRTILTRWGIKPRKIFGELTYPFDLAVFGMKEITKCLRTDFSEFFDNLEYTPNGWIKAPNCIYFSHDKHYKQNDKEKLIKLYTKRIKNFRAEIRESEDILFFQILGEDEDIENQYKAISKLRYKEAFKFAVVDTQNVAANINLENLYILKLPFPSEEYKKFWWKKEFYNSKEGKKFERQIADFCLEVLKK